MYSCYSQWNGSQNKWAQFLKWCSGTIFSRIDGTMKAFVISNFHFITIKTFLRLCSTTLRRRHVTKKCLREPYLHKVRWYKAVPQKFFYAISIINSWRDKILSTVILKLLIFIVYEHQPRLFANYISNKTACLMCMIFLKTNKIMPWFNFTLRCTTINISQRCSSYPSISLWSISKKVCMCVFFHR